MKTLSQILEDLLATMDVPSQRALLSGQPPAVRQRNLGWLGRNLGFRNFEHPDFSRAMGLIHTLTGEGDDA